MDIDRINHDTIEVLRFQPFTVQVEVDTPEDVEVLQKIVAFAWDYAGARADEPMVRMCCNDLANHIAQRMNSGPVDLSKVLKGEYQ
jgi:hypothetical protein